jgi:hypothetical protein
LYHAEVCFIATFTSHWARNADGQVVLRLIDLARMIENPRTLSLSSGPAAPAYKAPALRHAQTARFLPLPGDGDKEEKKSEARRYVIAAGEGSADRLT